MVMINCIMIILGACYIVFIICLCLAMGLLLWWWLDVGVVMGISGLTIKGAMVVHEDRVELIPMDTMGE